MGFVGFNRLAITLVDAYFKIEYSAASDTQTGRPDAHLRSGRICGIN